MTLLRPRAIPQAWPNSHQLSRSDGCRWVSETQTRWIRISRVLVQDKSTSENKTERVSSSGKYVHSPPDGLSFKFMRSTSAGATILPVLKAHFPDAVSDIPPPRPGTSSLSFTSPRTVREQAQSRETGKQGAEEKWTVEWDDAVFKSRSAEKHAGQVRLSLAYITAVYIARSQLLRSKVARDEENHIVSLEKELAVEDEDETGNSSSAMEALEMWNNQDRAITTAKSPSIANATPDPNARRVPTPYTPPGDSLLPKAAIDYIKGRGYEETHLALWVFVLRGETGAESMRRLSYVYIELGGNLPVFLVLHTLRRQKNVGHNELRALLNLVRDYFTNDKIKRSIIDSEARIIQGKYLDTTSMDIIILRLLRLAHERSPIHIPAVINLIIDFRLTLDYTKSVDQITYLCNEIIHLVSSPTPTSPFAMNLQFSSQAQFDLLAAMSKSTPPILLTRTGYRGMVRTRLAAPKTEEDKARVREMRASWPPYKKEIDGWSRQFATHGDGDPQVTTAGLVLMEMEKAGYPMHLWEEAAMVLAGRDVDGSPTIPTRTFFRPSVEKGEVEMVYAAQVQASRTVHEAWAIFEGYLKSRTERGEKGNMGLDVFKVMFTKVLMAKPESIKITTPKTSTLTSEGSGTYGKRLLSSLQHTFAQKERDTPHTAKPVEGSMLIHSHGTLIHGVARKENLPLEADPMSTVAGDRLEPVPPPSNPNEAIHTSTSIPSVRKLWAMLVDSKITPDVHILALVMSHERSRTRACTMLDVWHKNPNSYSSKYLSSVRWWNLEELQAYQDEQERRIKHNLSHKSENINLKSSISQHGHPPHTLLRAFIRVLTATRKTYQGTTKLLRDIPHALTLIKLFNLSDKEVYKCVLSGLLKLPSIAAYPSSQFGQSTTHQLIWTTYKEMSTKTGPPDAETLHLLIRAAIKDFAFHVKHFYTTNEYTTDFPLSILTLGEWDGKPPLAHILHIFQYNHLLPSNATLHALLRLCLLTAHDSYRPVGDMVEWMVRHQHRLETKNRRLALIVIRAFLDDEMGGVRHTHSGQRQWLGEGEDRRKAVLRRVEMKVKSGMEGWGAWVTRREVGAYRKRLWQVVPGEEEDDDLETDDGEAEGEVVDEGSKEGRPWFDDDEGEDETVNDGIITFKAPSQNTKELVSGEVKTVDQILQDYKTHWRGNLVAYWAKAP